MAVLALAAPTVPIGSVAGSGGGPTVAWGNLVPAAETSLGANVGFSFPNNGAVLCHIVTGTVIGTIAFVVQRTVESNQVPAFTPLGPGGVALAISSSYIFGPFSPADFNDPNGLFQCTWTGFTGGSVGVYQLPTSRFGLQT